MLLKNKVFGCNISIGVRSNGINQILNGKAKEKNIMNGNLEDLIIPIIIFPSIVIIFKAFFDYLTRKRLIEKGIVGEEAKQMFQNSIERYVPSSLKWGLVLVLVGATTVVLKAIPGYVEPEIAFGVILISAGAGLLIYYFLASHKAREERSRAI